MLPYQNSRSNSLKSQGGVVSKPPNNRALKHSSWHRSWRLYIYLQSVICIFSKMISRTWLSTYVCFLTLMERALDSSKRKSNTKKCQLPPPPPSPRTMAAVFCKLFLDSTLREGVGFFANSCRVFIGSVGRLVSQRVGLEGQRVGRTVHRQSAGDRGRRLPCGPER